MNQLENSIPLLPFKDNQEDKELIKLAHYLEFLIFEENKTKKSLRKLNSEYFGFSRLEGYESINEAYEGLFYS